MPAPVFVEPGGEHLTNSDLACRLGGHIGTIIRLGPVLLRFLDAQADSLRVRRNRKDLDLDLLTGFQNILRLGDALV